MNYLNTIYENNCITCVKETSHGDVSFTPTKHMFDRTKNPDDNHFVKGLVQIIYVANLTLVMLNFYMHYTPPLFLSC